MKTLWYSRRTFLGFCGLLILLVLGLKGEQVGFHIVSIVLGIMGANAAEGILTASKKDSENAAK